MKKCSIYKKKGQFKIRLTPLNKKRYNNYSHNSFPSQANFVAKKSTINHKTVHSNTNQNGDIHSNTVQIAKSQIR